jgi:hypothetical protein
MDWQKQHEKERLSGEREKKLRSRNGSLESNEEEGMERQGKLSDDN